jgi:hypothetical protein
MIDTYDGNQPVAWRNERYSLIKEHYGQDYFKNKTILEIGAAWGHIGNWFTQEYGAIVTCTDHYSGHIDIIKQRHPHIEAFVQNVNDPWPTDRHYDFLIHMGVVYHQPKDMVEIRLKEACSICDEMLLETDTDWDDGIDPYYIQERPRPPDEHLWEPMATECCGPTKAFIDRVLTESDMTFTSINYTGKRYLWFCVKEKSR